MNLNLDMNQNNNVVVDNNKSDLTQKCFEALNNSGLLKQHEEWTIRYVCEEFSYLYLNDLYYLPLDLLNKINNIVRIIDIHADTNKDNAGILITTITINQ